MIIGNESALTIPASAHYSSVMNVRPGNGDTVTDNPPLFSWFYWTNHVMGGDAGGTSEAWKTNTFIFQIATNSSFTGTLAADVTTPFNFYNYLAPIPTNAGRTIYWRVIYQRTNTPFWTNAYSFTIAPGATNWDRSMFADSTWLSARFTHPYFCFTNGQQASIGGYMTNHAYYSAFLSAATTATNQAWFTSHSEWPTNATVDPNGNTSVQVLADSRPDYLGWVLTFWTFSGDNRWTNASLTGWLITNLNHYANWYQHPSNYYAAIDAGNNAVTPANVFLAAAGYDWMYDVLGSDTATFSGRTRTNLLALCRNTMAFQTHVGQFYMDTVNGSLANWLPGYNWPTTTETVPAQSIVKLPNSHSDMTWYYTMVAGLVTRGTAQGNFQFDLCMNYLLARGSPYAGFSAYHGGPYGYVYGHAWRIGGNNGVLDNFMAFDSSFPEAQLWRTPFLNSTNGFADWYTRLFPYRVRKAHGPWGDGSGTLAAFGNHAGYLGYPHVGLKLAMLTRSGAAMQAYNINQEYNNATSFGGWLEIPMFWHYTNTPTPATNSTSKVWVEDGYVSASSLSSSEFGGYTNAVGFTARSSPRGPLGGHDVYTLGSYDMWAYGTQITDGGGNGLYDYDYAPESATCLFVDAGSGMLGPGGAAYQNSPLLPVHSSVYAFTNSGTNFVYAAMELTGSFTNAAHPYSNVVTKVRRHILFPRSKYFVLYDEFATTTPANFAFRWHVPWVHRYQSGGSALANETDFGSGFFGSNSLAMTTNGFTYVAGNATLADDGRADPNRVPIHVVFANATNQWGVFRATGLNGYSASASGVNGTSGTNSTLNPFLLGGYVWHTLTPDRCVGMWVTNRAAATNFTLLTVIVPQEPGKSAPAIERISDTAVSVTYDGVTETNVFGTNYASAFTYMVDVTTSPNQAGSPGEGGSSASSASAGIIRFNGGMRVKGITIK